MKLLVLMQNDYPIGIYTTWELADSAANIHYKERYGNQYPLREKKLYNYRTYEFVVDAEAK